LISKQSDLEWIVKGRLIFNHIAEKQHRFLGENEIQMHFAFNPKENKEASIKSFLNNESQGIYQYLIEPFQHYEKPLQFEKLELKR